MKNDIVFNVRLTLSYEYKELPHAFELPINKDSVDAVKALACAFDNMSCRNGFTSQCTGLMVR